MKKYIVSLGLLSIILVIGCTKDPITEPQDNTPIAPNTPLNEIPYNPTPFAQTSPRGLPTMYIPEDNPLTVQGIKLGRLLFHDPILSGDSSMTCASCHNTNKAFTDGRAKSIGITGTEGNRNAMSLINVGYNFKLNRNNNFNWDGAFKTLEEQVLSPVEHPLELNADWDIIVEKFKNHTFYPILFRKAFGIENKDQINKELAAKALAQYLRTLNSANSYFDRTKRESYVYLSDFSTTADAQRGFDLFVGDALGSNNITLGQKDAECAHCHSISRDIFVFARNDFSNNGLDDPNTATDLGLGGITNNARDKAKFREVTMRNIALTAPYMHDGRFQTLEEVLEHYTSGGHAGTALASELATAATLRTLDARDKADIIAFLHTLTDTSYFDNPHFLNPFDIEENPWQ